MGHAAGAAAAAKATADEATEATGEEVSMEEVLGGGVRKQPAPVDVEPEPEERHAESHTV